MKSQPTTAELADLAAVLYRYSDARNGIRIRCLEAAELALVIWQASEDVLDRPKEEKKR